MQDTAKTRRPQRRLTLSPQQTAVLRAAFYTNPELLTQEERAVLAARLFPSKRAGRTCEGRIAE